MVWWLFQPPSAQSTSSGASSRSEANFRLSECQPRRLEGGSSAIFSARFHQSRTRCRETGRCGSVGDGRTGASPMAGLWRRATSTARVAAFVRGVSCPTPILSASALHQMRPCLRSISDHNNLLMAPMRCPVSCARTSATRKRQSIPAEAAYSASYSCSVRTGRTGLRSLGTENPLSGFLSKKTPPSAALIGRVSTPVENVTDMAVENVTLSEGGDEPLDRRLLL